MEETTSKSMAGFAWSFAISSIINGILVILKGILPGFQSFMTLVLGHHWVTQGAFILVLFLLLGWIFAATGVGARQKASSLSWLISIFTVAGGLIIVIYNIIEVL